MTQEKRHYSRYAINRGNQALWKGDPSEKGAQFRQVIISSDEWMLSEGTFQVCALEGTGNGIVGGKFSADPTPKVLFDADFQGLDAAGKKFREIIAEAEAQGFEPVTLIEELEFQEKLRASAGK